jgi:hypothetical protein
MEPPAFQVGHYMYDIACTLIHYLGYGHTHFVENHNSLLRRCHISSVMTFL